MLSAWLHSLAAMIRKRGMGGVGIRGSVAKCGGILNYFMARVRERIKRIYP